MCRSSHKEEPMRKDNISPQMEHIFIELRIMREVLLNREGLVLVERDVATETSSDERPMSALERLQKSRGKLV